MQTKLHNETQEQRAHLEAFGERLVKAYRIRRARLSAQRGGRIGSLEVLNFRLWKNETNLADLPRMDGLKRQLIQTEEALLMEQSRSKQLRQVSLHESSPASES